MLIRPTKFSDRIWTRMLFVDFPSVHHFFSFYQQDGVNQLSDVEKLLLYLKLPAGAALGYHKE